MNEEPERGSKMNGKIFAVNLVVPLLAVIIIAAIAGWFRRGKKESIKDELFEYFVKVWNADEKEPEAGEEESFFRRFFKMFVKAYEYEKYKESANKLKYYFYKLLVLFVILCIPFLSLFLITSKEWILNDAEWTNMYLYTVILVPLIFAYLVNKYIRISQYHEIWYRHMRNRHHMEWRMMVFVKDYELLKAGKKPEDVTEDSLKIDFINDMSEYWKTETVSITEAGAKEENIFADFAGLFGK